MHEEHTESAILAFDGKSCLQQTTSTAFVNINTPVTTEERKKNKTIVNSRNSSNENTKTKHYQLKIVRF